MGGVCSNGINKRSINKSELEERNHEHHDKSSGFSGKLKSGKSSGGKQQNKIDDSSHAYPDFDAFEKTSNLYDSGELQLSFSRELKPSTPARTPAAAKVQMKCIFPFLCLNVLFG